MSELAERDRAVKRGWATPGGSHDRLVTRSSSRCRR